MFFIVMTNEQDGNYIVVGSLANDGKVVSSSELLTFPNDLPTPYRPLSKPLLLVEGVCTAILLVPTVCTRKTQYWFITTRLYLPPLT